VLADAREQAERWCSALWGDREGWALTAVGRSPHLRHGRFRHARLDHLPYRWPDDRDRLLSETLPHESGDGQVLAGHRLRPQGPQGRPAVLYERSEVEAFWNELGSGDVA